jgi:pyruvate kinase
VYVEFDKLGPYHITQGVVDVLVEREIAKKGDRVIVTRGDLLGDEAGGSNAMKIVDVK